MNSTARSIDGRLVMRLILGSLLAVGALATLSLTPALRQALSQTPPATTPAAKPPTKIVFSTGHVTSEVTNGDTRITTMTDGNATHEDTAFSAGSIVVRSKGDVHEVTCTADAQGKSRPNMSDPENVLSCDKMIIYSTPRRAEMTGHVKMVSTPKPKPGEKATVVSQPTTLTCDALSYDYGAKKAHATGNVQVVQKERTVWSDEATYDQSVELVTLKGNVRMQNSATGNTGADVKSMKDADTLAVSLKTDWIDIVAKPGGAVIFELNVKDQEAPKTPATGSTTPPAGGTPPTTP